MRCRYSRETARGRMREISSSFPSSMFLSFLLHSLSSALLTPSSPTQAPLCMSLPLVGNSCRYKGLERNDTGGRERDKKGMDRKEGEGKASRGMRRKGEGRERKLKRAQYTLFSYHNDFCLYFLSLFLLLRTVDHIIFGEWSEICL